MSDVNPYGSNQEFVSQPLDTAVGTRSMVVKRIDPFSCGKILGGLYAIFGVVWGIVFSAMGVVALFNSGKLASAGIVATSFGLVVAPIFFGIFGFVGGAIGAALFNIATGFLGGVKIDVEA